MVVLEELDSHKRGSTEVARNGRQVSRTLDALVEAQKRHRPGRRAEAWMPAATRAPRATCSSRPCRCTTPCPASLPQGKADNQILGVVQALRAQESQGREVIAGVQRHQHARQSPRPGAARRGLPQRQGAGRRRPALHRRTGSACRTSGARPRTCKAGKKAIAASTACAGRLTEQLLINQFVYFEAPERAQPARPRGRSCAATPPCWKCCATTAAPSTTSGA